MNKNKLILTALTCTLAAGSVFGAAASKETGSSVNSSDNQNSDPNFLSRSFDNFSKHGYVTGFIGMAMPQKFTGYAYEGFAEPKNTLNYGGAIGYRVNPYLRTDVSLQIQNISSVLNFEQTKVTSSNNSFSTHVNGYYDMAVFNNVTPYVTMGLGYASVKAKLKQTATAVDSGRTMGLSNIGAKTYSNFSWKIGAGFKRQINEDISVDFGYRYLDLGSVEVTESYDDRRPEASFGTRKQVYNTKLGSHVLNVGVSYHF